MGTYAFSVFSATGVKSGMDNVLHSVAKFVMGKFPRNTIKAHYVDTRDKVRDFYRNITITDKDKPINQNVEEIRKLPRPHLYVGYTWDANFDTTETGLGETQPYMYPNAYFIDEKMQSVFPVLKDKDRDIFVGTNNLRIRVTCEFLFSCQSKEEQISLYNHILNNIKMMYMYAIRGIKTDYTMPNVVINSLKNMLFKDGASMKEIGKDLDKYLLDKSGEAIKPVWRNGKEEDKFYELNYFYRQVDFKITSKPVIDDGDKKDSVYDNYTIRFPAVVEFYIPLNYVVRSPKFIPGALGGVNVIGDYVILDKETDEDNRYQVVPIIKSYKDKANRPYVDKNNMKLIVRDEYALADKDDYYELEHAMSDTDKYVFRHLTSSQKSQCYQILLFEGDRLLDKDVHCVNEDWTLMLIKAGDLLKTQMIEIRVDPKLAAFFLLENERAISSLKKES